MKKEGVKQGEDQPLEQSWPIKEGRERPQRMGVKRSDAEGGSEMDAVWAKRVSSISRLQQSEAAQPVQPWPFGSFGSSQKNGKRTILLVLLDRSKRTDSKSRTPHGNPPNNPYLCKVIRWEPSLKTDVRHQWRPTAVISEAPIPSPERTIIY